ncbi:uncharacterized protein LOC143022832 [Oratosquilla oratoria]|uniref:uncharacterized protein LOC143022832 n=1 Tax=Oratosquilla oratoria TaxID=337810 RepID=UPI003F75749A
MTNGKYEIPLPMIEKPRIVPDSEPMVVKRLQRLKCKFKDDEYYRQSKQFMINLLEKGYAEEVPKCEVRNQQAWYVPHFGVCHPTKKDKVRVVFDCAARVNDLSLNDLLRQGPDISNLLLGVLLRFRLGLYACTADIETMYYQVKVPEDDRDYLHFLWWKDGHIGSDIVKLRMTSHPFGASCSPSIANYALKRVVQDHGNQFHKSVSEIVLNNFYVDDLLVSSDDIIKKARYNSYKGSKKVSGTKPCVFNWRLVILIPKTWMPNSVTIHSNGFCYHISKTSSVIAKRDVWEKGQVCQ